MTLTAQQIDDEADLLHEAEQTVTQIRQTTLAYPSMTIDEAYAVQRAWRDRKLAAGRHLIGHKIGLTSRAMQAAMQITTPDSGFLTDDMVFSPGGAMDANRFPDLKIEVELAFVLSHDLVAPRQRPLTIPDVLAATDYVIPAVELIAARSHRIDPDTGRARTVIDTIADNAADAGIITGGERIDPHATDLTWVGAMLAKNNTIEETGLAGGVLGHPAIGLIWLAERYAARGWRLEAGHTVLTGSFTRPVAVANGDDFKVDFGAHGSFTLSFRAENKNDHGAR